MILNVRSIFNVRATARLGALFAPVLLATWFSMASTPVTAETPPVATTPSSAASAVEEPAGYKMDSYRTPVPHTLKGAKVVVDADEAKKLQDSGAVFIDVYPRAPKPPNLPATTVWREPAHRSIEGAHWVPNVGYGLIAPETQRYFDDQLASLTKSNKAQPVVVFCLRDCWMSWNAAKRAMEMGYTAVYWFPEGSDTWEENGYPIAVIEPMKPLNGKF